MLKATGTMQIKPTCFNPWYTRLNPLCLKSILLGLTTIACVSSSSSFGNDLVKQHDKVIEKFDTIKLTPKRDLQDSILPYKIPSPDVVTIPVTEEGRTGKGYQGSTMEPEESPPKFVPKSPENEATLLPKENGNVSSSLGGGANSSSELSPPNITDTFRYPTLQRTQNLNSLYQMDEYQDLDATKELLYTAARKGDTNAQKVLTGVLARMYQYGIGGVTDHDEAKRHYKIAAQRGDAEAKLELAKILLEAQDETSDEEEIRRLFSEAASVGLSSAQIEFGVWLQAQGEGKDAFDWYKQAANQNDLNGIFRLAGAYRDGIGVESDLEEARDLFEKAAAKRYAPAETQLAKMLLSGQGGSINKTTALALLRSASNQDYPPALFTLSQLYRTGLVVKRDSEKAYQQVQRAAELGLKEAIEIEPIVIKEYCELDSNVCATIPILYMTDRKETSDKRLDYRFANKRESSSLNGNSSTTFLHYGVVTTTVPAGPETSQEQVNVWSQMLKNLFEFPPRIVSSDDTVIRDIDPIAKRSDFGKALSLLLELRDSKRILVFVHGFNTSFSFAARRFAKFTSQIKYDGVPIMFSWPSYNKARLYAEDLDQVKQSCPRFTAALSSILQFGVNAHVDVVAHSMGAKLLFDSLTAGTGGQCDTPELNFSDVVLAAPDIKSSIFLENVDGFVNKATSVTLYASSKDMALYASSSVIRAGGSRLGQGGEDLTVHERLDSLDVSSVEKGIGHAYVFENDSVVRDVHELLVLDRPPGNRSDLTQCRRGELPFWVFNLNGISQCVVE